MRRKYITEYMMMAAADQWLDEIRKQGYLLRSETEAHIRSQDREKERQMPQWERDAED